MDHRPRNGIALALVVFTLLAAIVYSCAVNPVTGRRELRLVTFSKEEEIKLGAEAFTPAVQQQGGFYRDPTLEPYVQRVGERLARISHRPDLQYTFKIVNSSVPNAFALPGGFIVLNRGLLLGFENEAQMAAVLGHEIGHVTARHSIAAYQRAIAANLLLAGLVIGTGGRQEVMAVSGITAALIQSGFSREQEREADHLGIDYMVQAGYSPEGAIQLHQYFFEELEQRRNPMFLEGLFRTHPFSKDRMEAARARITQEYPQTIGNPNYTLNPGDYRQHTARMREIQKAYDVAQEGDEFARAKRYAEALAKYQEAARMAPEQAPFHSSAGAVLLLGKNYPAAEEALSRAIRLDAEFFEPHYLLGRLHFERNNPRAAIPALERSMDLLPTKQGAALLSKSYSAIGDTARAKHYAEMAQ
jgi:beta-barrel assembly-enhancing protease